MQNFKPSFSGMMNMSSNMETVNNLNELESFNHSVHELISLSNDGFSDQQRSQLPFSTFSNELQNGSNIPHIELNHESVACFFPPGRGDPPGGHGCGSMNGVYDSDCLNQGGKKRKRNNSREVEKPREVVHVRAKRGQATDSHSLAERLRREKINEKLRCLQDLVPGCYKTMGMAVMLDVIINYVRSLQDQIDFLSMKLSAASLFYDFNSSEMDAVGTIQATNGFEAQGMEKMMGEGYGMLPQFHPSCPP